MTTILQEREATTFALRAEEVAELEALTASLPQLVHGYSAAIPLEPPLRLDAALWEAAGRAAVEVRCGDTVYDVIDRLSARGWNRGHARDALMAFLMMRSTGRIDPRAAARVIAYLELRARFG